MGLEWQLAWRNVWRNSRRTALTVAATVFAVFLVVVFVAMAAGVHGKMIEDSVRMHSGHLEVSGKGYLQNRTLDQYVRLRPAVVNALDAQHELAGWAPRVDGFALISKDSATQGVIVLGVDPRREASVSSLASRVEKGAFLPSGVKRGIVLGGRLARNIGARLGDELLLYSVAYSQEMAYELFTVTGILKLPELELDRRLSVISLRDAQDFFVYGNRVSEIALLATSADGLPALRDRILHALPQDEKAPIEVHLWNEVMPELEQFIFLDDAGMYIMLVILVVVVAFGILNTLLMSVLERTRELGVLLALGLRPIAIFRVVYLESLMLAVVGLAIGLAVALPTVLYMQGHPIPLGGDLAQATAWLGIEPIMTFKLKPLNPLGSVLTILSVAVIAALYPALKASRARPVDALRSL